MKKWRNKKDYTPAIDATLDLHGCRREEARIETITFLDEALSQNMKRVRIVVGKGTHSPEGIAVLPDTVKAVLAEYNLPYTPAKLYDGGEGALEVRL